MSKVNIFTLSFNSIEKKQLLEKLINRINNQEKTFLVTANPEIVMYAKQNSEYSKVVNKANFVIADGIGVVIGSKILGTPVPERIAGFDLMCDLLQRGNQEGWCAYFLGAKNEVIGKAVSKIQRDYPNLNIAGYHDGYFNDSTEIKNIIQKTRPDLVFVALGFPRQEKWIHENLKDFDKGLFIGVGGSFDVLAGTVKRAPLIWQKMNLEWLYRLLQQPSRWKRMLVLPQFVMKVFIERLSKKY